MRQLLFSLDRLEFVGEGKVLVGGRCCADEIRKGDKVQLMVRLSSSGTGENRVEEEMPVSLTMPSFSFYGHEIDTLDHGHTAGLHISVQMGTGLRLGWYLKGQNA